MKKKYSLDAQGISRPINLNLFAFRFPPTAIVSILHRISGLLLVLLIPALLYLLQQSLLSAASFTNLQYSLANPLLRFGLWVLFSALVYHLFAGIRHLIMDYGYGESYAISRKTAYLVMVAAAIIITKLGVRLWP